MLRATDQPGKHPAFLHALSDLRYARANLEKKGGDSQMKWDESTAVGAIDRAIADIKQAAIDDGKNLDDHPPVTNAKEPPRGPPPQGPRRAREVAQGHQGA